MRILLSTASALLLAACATKTPPPAPVRPTPPVQPVQTGNLIGLSVQELGARFGAPSFQVREGPGLKLQWAGSACVLDAYLYPPASGAGLERVTYVEARRTTGDPTDQAACVAAIDAAG
ncbi:hypothetical protein ACFQPG_01145 [Sphingomonas sp. GCM10030256]|uniref:hypothetical protein n=1 Tax=Sphingomonas sp. GCM10030256 TaxID=3273427 RepID=UPI00360CEDAF